MTHAHESIYRCLGGMAPVRELAALCPPQGDREAPRARYTRGVQAFSDHERTFWRALPGFMNEWADIFQWGEWRYGIENRPEDLDLRRRMREKYMHIASLEARLVDESVGSIELRLGI